MVDDPCAERLRRRLRLHGTRADRRTLPLAVANVRHHTARDGDVVVSNTHLVSTMDITHAIRESAEQINEALTLWSSVRREEAVHGDISAYFEKVAWLLRLIDLVLCGRFAIAFGDRGLASDGSIGLRAHHGLCARPSRDQLFSFNGPWLRVVTRKLSSCNVRRVCASRVDIFSM